MACDSIQLQGSTASAATIFFVVPKISLALKLQITLSLDITSKDKIK